MTKVNEQNLEYRPGIICFDNGFFNGEEDKVGDHRELSSVIYILNS